MVTGEIETYFADVVVLATGGYGNVFFLSTNAMGCNVTADLAGAPQGRLHGQPLLHPDPPDLHPGLRRAPVEADPDERVAAQRRPDLGAEGARPTATRTRARSPRRTATTTWSGSTPRSATWSPATSPPGRRRTCATRAAASGPRSTGVRRGVYLDFADAIERLGREAIEDKYGNLFDMYARITGEDPYEVPMRIYPAVHYVMGGLWVDYDLQSTIPGPVRHRRGQLLRPRRQPARRLGADAGPGRRLLRAARTPSATTSPTARSTRSPRTTRRSSRRSSRCKARIDHFLTINGTRSVDSYHRELGNIMWEYCGMERTEDGLRKAIDLIRALRDDFWRNVKVLGTRREPQPVAGEGRPGGRLPRARRADVHRRAAPARVLRRPLPRRVADRGRRGAAPRRPVRLRRGLGVGRRGREARSCTRRTWSTSSSR